MPQQNFKNTFLLVHDVFHEVVNYIPDVVTMSMLKDMDCSGKRMMLGQGLSPDHVESLIAQGVEVVDSDFIFFMEENTFVHKQDKKNVIITMPEKKSDYSFESFIFLSHKTDILDHITGIHIPGMVLLEAARQSMLSIVQRYFLEESASNTRFTILSTKAEFHSFVLPASIKICSTLLNPRFSRKQGMTASLKSTIWQKNACCATFTIDFSCHDEKKILNHEISTFIRRFCRSHYSSRQEMD